MSTAIPNQKRPAVFLDRDGTLIEDRGHLHGPAEVVFYPWTAPALRRLQPHYLLFIVTHQRGVAEGKLTLEEVNRVNRSISQRLRAEGVTLTDVYCCPHLREQQCPCIKPKPFFLLQAAQRYDLDLARSFVIGDHPHDVATAWSVGATGIYVLTGHGRKHYGELPSDAVVVADLADAADWILAEGSGDRPTLPDQSEIARAADHIRAGGVVAFPTETVYGLGADALNPQAVAEIFALKGRPRFDPLIVHVAGPEAVPPLVRTAPPLAHRLMGRFWPGPLTLVLPKSEAVPDIVTAGLPTVALRLPAHPVARRLIRLADRPIAAPSANRFGRCSPTCVEHVREQLGDRVEVILDGGPCAVGVESTVLSLATDPPQLLRPGGIPVEELEEIVGPLAKVPPSQAVPPSPGLLPQHYAPRTPLVLLDEQEPLPPGAGLRIGLLTLTEPPRQEGFAAVEVLSPSGDLRQAAARFFAALHRLDRLGLDLIVARPIPEQGLGLAIMDRLRRAQSGGYIDSASGHGNQGTEG